MLLKSGQRGADSRSILPMHVLENGSACVDCPVGIGNPLHSHAMTSKTKVDRFFSTPLPQYHILYWYNNLRQSDDREASPRTVCIRTEVR